MIQEITEEFVNYNLLPGRTRSYTEAMGITWFWAYKLRSLKVALNHIRNNPLRALLANMGGSFLPDLPGVSIGSPITDNFLASAADSRLGYSARFASETPNGPALISRSRDLGHPNRIRRDGLLEIRSHDHERDFIASSIS